MRNFVTLILVCFSLGVTAQSVDLKPTKYRIGLVFSPDLYFTKGSTSTVIGYELEQNAFNYSTGLMVYFKPGRIFEFGSGLIYSNKDFTGTWYCDVCDFDSRPESFKLRYIEIPIIGRYYLLTKNPSLFCEAGLTNGFLWHDTNSKYGPMEATTYHLDGQIGLGTNINLGPRFQFTGSMLYKHGLTNALLPSGGKSNNDFPFESLALLTGIVYKI